MEVSQTTGCKDESTQLFDKFALDILDGCFLVLCCMTD